MEDIRAEKMEECRQEAMLDARLETDYEFFLEYNYDEIQDVVTSIDNLKSMFVNSGWYLERSELLDLLEI